MIGHGYGMPSAHAQFAAFTGISAVCFLLARGCPSSVPPPLRATVAAAAVVGSSVIAAARVYLGYHTPRQVLAGYTAGAVAAVAWVGATVWARRAGLLTWMLGWPLMRWMQVRDLLPELEPAAAGWQVWEARQRRREQ